MRCNDCPVTHIHVCNNCCCEAGLNMYGPKEVYAQTRMVASDFHMHAALAKSVLAEAVEQNMCITHKDWSEAMLRSSGSCTSCFRLYMAFSPYTSKVDQQAVLFDRNVGRGFGDGQGRINTPQVPWLQVICPEQVPPFHVNPPCLASA